MKIESVRMCEYATLLKHGFNGGWTTIELELHASQAKRLGLKGFGYLTGKSRVRVKKVDALIRVLAMNFSNEKGVKHEVLLETSGVHETQLPRLLIRARMSGRMGSYSTDVLLTRCKAKE